MSNRGRQNVASYLALDLQLDWREGADWFESALVDYDVASNWGNWVAAAGMTGGRLNQFNITKQSKDYDEVRDADTHLWHKCSIWVVQVCAVIVLTGSQAYGAHWLIWLLPVSRRAQKCPDCACSPNHMVLYSSRNSRDAGSQDTDCCTWQMTKQMSSDGRPCDSHAERRLYPKVDSGAEGRASESHP